MYVYIYSYIYMQLHKGPKAERNRIKTEELADTGEFDIVVTTFEILVSEVNFFKRKYVWTTIIVDEGHRLKNERSQLSEKLKSVSCLSKIILTGTPLQNNLRELWALLHFLAPDVFTPATAEKFETGFDLVRGLVDSNLLRRARKLLGVFMLRRVKDQVAISLPSRRELTVLVPLTSRQVEWYKRLLCGLDSDAIETVMRESTNALANGVDSMDVGDGSSISALTAAIGEQVKAISSLSAPSSSSSSSSSSSGGSGDNDWRKLMNLLLQLRKICNHIYLMPDAAPDPYDIGEHIVGGSGKLLMLDRMLPRLRVDGHRVLLFR
jgi:SWI/SNF-related matrix-associated actin-dependent regulator of chromatin subfamily A member 5